MTELDPVLGIPLPTKKANSRPKSISELLDEERELRVTKHQCERKLAEIKTKLLEMVIEDGRYDLLSLNTQRLERDIHKKTY